MPQPEIVAYLKQHRGRKFTVAQIAKGVGYGQGSVAASVRKLIKYNMIHSKVLIEKRVFILNGRNVPFNKHVNRVWL